MRRRSQSNSRAPPAPSSRCFSCHQGRSTRNLAAWPSRSQHKRAALKEIGAIAERRDQTVRIRSSSSRNWRDAILGEVLKERVTLIVLGVSVHPSEALLFGETANHLLEEGPRSLLFVAS